MFMLVVRVPVMDPLIGYEQLSHFIILIVILRDALCLPQGRKSLAPAHNLIQLRAGCNGLPAHFSYCF